MTHRVIAFHPAIASTGNSSQVAEQMEAAIRKEAEQGWTFVAHTTSQTLVRGDTGCFGIGAKPDSSTQLQFLIFKQG